MDLERLHHSSYEPDRLWGWLGRPGLGAAMGVLLVVIVLAVVAVVAATEALS